MRKPLSKTKLCRDCGEVKPRTEFYTQISRAGLHKPKSVAFCRTCSVVRSANWQKANRERSRAIKRASALRLKKKVVK